MQVIRKVGSVVGGNLTSPITTTVVSSPISIAPSIVTTRGSAEIVEDILIHIQTTPPSCPCHQNLDPVFFNRQPLDDHHHRHHEQQQQQQQQDSESLPLSSSSRKSSFPSERYQIFSARGIVAHASKPLDVQQLKLQSLPNVSLSLQRRMNWNERRHNYNLSDSFKRKNRYISTKTATTPTNLDTDFAFEMATSSVRYGWGVTKEVGWDLADLGARKIVIFTDKNLNNRSSHSSRLSSVETVLASIQEVRSQILVSGGDSSLLSNIQVYDDVECEPTDSSFKDAISFCRSHGNFDAYVAVGGGSVIDTCKAANLYATYPPLLSSSPSSSSEGEDYDFLAYVNPPIGRGLPVPGPLKPLIAIPTTAGTGSETTGVSIFDLVSMKAKTGIAHRRLKPTLGIIDPENTKTLPPQVAAASGFDVLCHSLESYTALPYNKRGPRPAKPLLRPAYQGSNPISDVWSLKALAMVTEFLPRATFDGPNDDDARAQVILAATFAGVGFGNAGVHLCHAMSYPVSGNVKSWKPSGYPGVQHPLIPHGISVVTHAPSVFRFTSLADPERHLHAADIMHQARTKSYLPRSVSSSYSAGDSGRLLADEVIEMMKKLQVPNGLKEMGFEESDIPLLVEGTIPQHRVTKLSPRPVGGEELSALFKDSMSVW